MYRYPRVDPPHPEIFGDWRGSDFGALIPTVVYTGDRPASMEIVAGRDAGGMVFCYIGWVSLVASGYDEGFRRRLAAALHDYLLRDGDTRKIFALCGQVMGIHLKISESTGEHVAKRSGTDRMQEFERRLDAYETVESHRVAVIEEVEASLARLGHPIGADIANAPMEPDGRRAGTYAWMLAEAIKGLPDSVMRSDCNARFEKLAVQVWGWRYPALTDGIRDRVLQDFRARQAALVAKLGDPQAGCPNVTIRMLYHFDAAGLPYSLSMFKLPEGDDSWKKNIERLQVAGIWDPRRKAAGRR
jgi:hypothetical protein